MNSVTLTLPDERPQSLNNAYAGQHWTKRKAEVERIRLAVRAEIDPETVEVFAGPVDVEITVFFADRPLDADNIPAKLYIDALRGWLLEDDDQRFVHSVRTVTALDKASPRVEIRIAPAPPEPLRYEDMLVIMDNTRCRCCLEPAVEADAVDWDHDWTARVEDRDDSAPLLADGGAVLVGIGEGCHHA
jgi:hypothetical protein